LHWLRLQLQDRLALHWRDWLRLHWQDRLRLEHLQGLWQLSSHLSLSLHLLFDFKLLQHLLLSCRLLSWTGKGQPPSLVALLAEEDEVVEALCSTALLAACPNLKHKNQGEKCKIKR
jgi:hypothetical protein